MRWRCIMLAATLVVVSPAIHADEEPQHRLAFSKRLGVEILAEMQNGHWCREALDLEVRARDRQLFVGESFNGLMRQVGGLIEKDCPKAKTALLKGMSADGSTAVYQGSASKARHWAPQPLSVGGDAQTVATTGSEAKAKAKKERPLASAPNPKADQTPTSASQVPASVSSGSTPQSSTPPPSTQSLALLRRPRDVNYASMMLRMVKDKPSLAQNDAVLRCWAQYRFGKEYSRFRRQEFKLQPVLKKAQADLMASVAEHDGQHITVTISTDFGSYDFKTQKFPISLEMNGITLHRSCHVHSDDVPDAFTVKILDLDAITGLPMAQEAAKAFVANRTRYRSVDREISIAVVVKVGSSGIVEGKWGRVGVAGTIESAAIFADSAAKQPLYRLASERLAKLRADRAAEKVALAKAEEARKAEQQRRQLLEQRERYIQALVAAPESAKLANWISDDQINTYARLDNLRKARAAALVIGKPVAVSLLIQADGNGRKNVATRWPGKLEVTTGADQPDLVDAGWYLVRGVLTVPEGDSVLSAQLLASKVFMCAAPKCADAADPEAIVDRKLAGLAASN